MTDVFSADAALNKATRLSRKGRNTEALSLCREILKRFPKNIRARNAFITLNLDLRGAKNVATEKNLEKLLDLFNAGDFFAVEIVGIHLASLNPDNFSLQYMTGAALLNLKKFSKAEEFFKAAIKITPDDFESHRCLGLALFDQNKFSEAVRIFSRAIKLNPESVQAHLSLGKSHIKLGNIQSALTALNSALKFDKNSCYVHFYIGEVLKNTSDLEGAERAYYQAIDINSKIPEFYKALGDLRLRQQKYDAAVSAFNSAVNLRPQYPAALNNLGNAYKLINNFDSAIEAYIQATEYKPDYSIAFKNLGNLMKDLGRFDEAISAYQTALDLDPINGEIYWSLSSIKFFATNDPLILKMKSLVEENPVGMSELSDIYFALAKAFDDCSEFKQSYEFLKKGNTAKRESRPYSRDIDKNLFKRITVLQEELTELRQIIPQKPSKKVPIFILGMPRSGTSLVEQIVSAHSDVCGAGELEIMLQDLLPIAKGDLPLNEDALLTTQHNYNCLLNQVSSTESYITDKMPHNFLLIGFIYKMFPTAKIVHVTRCPEAVCWSNYKLSFSSNQLNYMYDLNDIVWHYQLYEQLMSFWSKQFPGRIYHLNYESLVETPSEEIPRLINYLGLNFERDCLVPHRNLGAVRTASSKQVRQKIYKGSSDNWKNYKHLLTTEFDSFKV